MSDLSRLESDVLVLRSAHTIIAAAVASARIESLRNPDAGARTDIGIAVEYIDAALDQLDDAIATIAPHLPSFTPPSAVLPTAEPDTGHEVCPACSHDLELNADLRCIRCGTPS